jgi:hypothetical protein
MPMRAEPPAAANPLYTSATLRRIPRLIGAAAFMMSAAELSAQSGSTDWPQWRGVWTIE